MLVINVDTLTKNSNPRMTPFDFLKLVHNKKVKWEDLTEDEQKTYNTFIINKALSFNSNYLDIVNKIQHFTPTPKQSFKYFQSMLPDYFRFQKWIKGHKDKSYNPALLVILSTYFECSTNEAKDYLDLMDRKKTKQLLNTLGIQDNEIKKLIKK